MSLFKPKKTEEELYTEASRLRAEEEVLSRQQEIAEKKATISQLEKQYGHDWKKTLGVNKLTDIQTLKSFLVGSKSGLEKVGGVAQNNSNRLSPLPPSDMKALGNRRF